MLKKLFFIFFVPCVQVQAQQLVQYFDGANTNTVNSVLYTIQSSTNNVWQVGPPQKTLFSAASTTPNAMITDTVNNYPPNNQSAFTFTFVNSWQAPCFVVIEWKQKLDMEKRHDGGIVEFSTNSGQSWQNTHNNSNIYQFYGFQPANKDTINGNFCFSGTDIVWRDIWLCLGPNLTSTNDSILFRFTFVSDSGFAGKEGWMIDNLRMSKTFIHPAKENSKAGRLLVYPNVTSGIVNVELLKKSMEDQIDNIDLLDGKGEVVERYGRNYSKVVLDISKHPPGLYYLRVLADRKTSTHKILYEKP